MVDSFRSSLNPIVVPTLYFRARVRNDCSSLPGLAKVKNIMEVGELDNTLLKAFVKRRLALVLDEFSQPCQAILVSPAQEISQCLVNELLSLSGGLLCVALSPERVRALMLSPMSRPRTDPTRDGHAAWPSPVIEFCESVEAREGVSTGISAADRALTISILGEENPSPRHLVKPGHIFPVEAREGGVLARYALPEGALDLVKMAGFNDAAAFIYVLNEHGELRDRESCLALATEHEIPFVTLTGITLSRLKTETLIFKVAEAKLPTRLAGEMRSCVYRSTIHSGEHVALVKGSISADQPVLTRVQPEYTFGDVFGGDMPPTRSQLHRSLKAIGERGSGILVYLRRPFSGQLLSQLSSKSQAISQTESRGVDHKPVAMMRDYGVGAQILRNLGVRKVELMTGSEVNLVGLKAFNLEVVCQRPIPL